MQKKISLPKDNRIQRDMNYQKLQNIENEIRQKVEALYSGELIAVRGENKKLELTEQKFRNKVAQMLPNLTTKTKLRVHTQVGKGHTVIQKYEGHLAYIPKRGQRYFNFIDPNFNEGKEFTIGFSCLQSIEIIE